MGLAPKELIHLRSILDSSMPYLQNLEVQTMEYSKDWTQFEFCSGFAVCLAVYLSHRP